MTCAPTEQATGAQPSTGERGSVLVVDDEPLFLASTVALLRAAGFECDSTPFPERAIECLSRRQYDVVVLDLVIDGKQQLDLLKQLGNSVELPAVILVTGHPSIESAVSAVDLGLAGYLLKPFEIENLIDRLDDGIRRKRLTTLLTQTESSLRTASDTLAHLARVFESGGPQARGIASNLPDPETAEQLESLTARERNVVDELLQGYRVSTIGRRLGISENTVRRHLKSVFLKLEVSSQAQLLERLKP